MYVLIPMRLSCLINDVRIIKETMKGASRTANHETLIKLHSKIEDVTGIKSKENNDRVIS